MNGRLEIDFYVPAQGNLDIGELGLVEPVTKIIGNNFHKCKIGFLGIPGLSLRDVKPNQEITNHWKVLDLLLTKVSHLERPCILFGENGLMNLFAVLEEAGTS